MRAEATQSERWGKLGAFAVIYFVWGSTFLAIRVGVREVPPLLFAALRFFTAGALLLPWSLLRREALPRGRQWGSLLLLAVLIFACDYGLLFWAERRISSGLAAVLMATIPAWTAAGEIAILRTQRVTVRLLVALAAGLLGVAVLLSRSAFLPSDPVDTRGAIAMVVASICWSLASVLARRLPLPGSKVMSSSMQMLLGGAMLGVATLVSGEARGFTFGRVAPAAWWSLAYLIGAGSILGFTSYVWLLHRESPTRVGTYAYVNPLVAVALGWWLGGEAVGVRTLLGTACVLASVVAITTMPKPRQPA